MSKQKRILEILEDGKPHSYQELVPVTHRFSAAIHKLRENGYKIETIPVAHNNFAYQWVKSSI